MYWPMFGVNIVKASTHGYECRTHSLNNTTTKL